MIMLNNQMVSDRIYPYDDNDHDIIIILSSFSSIMSSSVGIMKFPTFFGEATKKYVPVTTSDSFHGSTIINPKKTQTLQGFPKSAVAVARNPRCAAQSPGASPGPERLCMAPQLRRCDEMCCFHRIP